jgi:hypothetical protein
MPGRFIVSREIQYLALLQVIQVLSLSDRILRKFLTRVSVTPEGAFSAEKPLGPAQYTKARSNAGNYGFRRFALPVALSKINAFYW